jgi:acyl-CoA dehydrogenase
MHTSRVARRALPLLQRRMFSPTSSCFSELELMEGISFNQPEEYKMVKELAATFVDDFLIPLEPTLLEREANGGKMRLTKEESGPLMEKCRELGLWGLDLPEEFGGVNLPNTVLVTLDEEVGRTMVPFTFPPDSPNLHMMLAACNDEQKDRYMYPYARGETVSAIGISEPGAGADPRGMKTKAVKDGDSWVLNGTKIWISKADIMDHVILMAVADTGDGGKGGMTAFFVDKDTPGLSVSREIKMVGGQVTYELVLEDCRISDANKLGEVGKGFEPMQTRLTRRRLEMAAWSIGIAKRALQMTIEQANQREAFGSKLRDKQAIQWWVADTATKIRASRLMALECAWKQDHGYDVRTEASMLKFYATEMATEAVDNAMQAWGAMGMTKDLPLHILGSEIRTMRIYDGPSEVHRMVVARNFLNGFADI